MTERFANHRVGHSSNPYVRRHGLSLPPERNECFNPMPFAAARQLERKLADELPEQGYAVWHG